MNKTNYTSLATTLVLAAVASAYGQDAPPVADVSRASTPQWLKETFDGKLPEALANGKFNLNARLRYEFAETQTTSPSHAPTLRTRFGFTTAPVNGFQAMLEAENVLPIGDKDNYNAAGLTGAGKAVVADPEVTQLNQAWLSYANWDTTLKGGRQRIVFDNARFIGNVGWRQNEQTYDAVLVQNTSIDKLTATYGYLWEVNRIFGDDSGLAGGLRDLNSDSHVVNLSYTGLPWGTLTAYGYLLALNNGAPAVAANSTATFGASFGGSRVIAEETGLKVSYRAEFARQFSYRNAPVPYSASYYHLNAGADYDRYSAGVGYEVLGSDSGLNGFRTPLATAHAFNGWADAFLATPATGLRDVYVFAGVKLPYEIPLKVIYHKFDADYSALDYGHEWDVVASKSLGKHWKATAKYAWLDGRAPVTTDIQKLWLQMEFNF